jgi:hypothetical protein
MVLLRYKLLINFRINLPRFTVLSNVNIVKINAYDEIFL